MSKIFALYINEMIKIIRKISIIVLLSIMILGVIGFGALMKFQEYINNNQNLGYQYEEKTSEIAANELQMQEEALKNIQTRIDSASEDEKADLEQQKYTIQLTIDKIKYSLENNIPLYAFYDFRTEALNKLVSYKSQLYTLKLYPNPSDQMKSSIAMYEGLITTYETAINNKDYATIINAEKESVNLQTDVTSEEKKILIEGLDLKLKLNPTGITDPKSNEMSYNNSIIEQIGVYKRSLLNNIDYTTSNYGGSAKPLTPQGREKIQNDLAVAVYKINNSVTTESESSMFSPKSMAILGMFGFGIFIVVLLIMILAGGSVSSEISTGSIKSLIISPAKRWKIFIAKVMALITIGLLTTLILYVISILTYGVLWGFSSVSPYIYATGGVAHEMNYYLSKFLYLLVSYIEVIFYMTFALMLSVITRNTAVSVGISIAIYFAGNIANSFLLLFAKGEWLKFVPFNNLSLADRVFSDPITNTVNMSVSGSQVSPLNLSVAFSLCYIAVLVICMFYTALDSFNRRDIK